MSRTRIRTIALALLAVTVIAGIAAYFSSGDTVTNKFNAAVLKIYVKEPHWKSDVTVIPEQETDKDPYIVNAEETPAYVFMEVTVPAQKIVIEDNSGGDKGKYENTAVVPLFRFIDQEGRSAEDRFSTEQAVNPGWYFMKCTDNKDSFTYLYAYTGDYTDNTMTPLLTDEWTSTPLFNKVIFCNARENDELSGSRVNVEVRVYGIQTDFLKSSQESESTAENVWKVLSK